MRAVIEQVGSGGMVDGPRWIGRRIEDLLDLVTPAPPPLTNGDEARGRSPSHGDDDLFAGLDAADQLGCLLTHLTESDTIVHGDNIAQVLQRRLAVAPSIRVGHVVGHTRVSAIVRDASRPVATSASSVAHTSVRHSISSAVVRGRRSSSARRSAEDQCPTHSGPSPTSTTCEPSRSSGPQASASPGSGVRPVDGSAGRRHETAAWPGSSPAGKKVENSLPKVRMISKR